MSVATPIIPETTNSRYDQHRLEQLLLSYKATLDGQKQSIIVSLSQIIDEVDPLSTLAFLTHEKINNFFKDEIYFYWENPGKTEAILGYGVTEFCQLNRVDRFAQSQQFVKDCFHKIVKVNQHNLSNSFPHIFCGFTFFSESNTQEFPFPSAFAFLPKLQILKQKRNSLLIFNLLIDSETNIKKLADQTTANLKSISKIKPYLEINKPEKQSIILNPKYHMIKGFESSVASALKSIKADHFQKLVLANALDLTSSQDFSIIDCLKNLRYYHPDCYIFAINNGKNNCFVGASPERLISLHNQQLLTDALAGSTSRGKTKLEDYYLAQKLLKSSKERREHQVVIEFIVQRLINLGLIPQISPLKVLKLSNIQHLWTPIYTQLNPNIHPLEVVENLHPTPAVSGFPTGVTCQEIKRYESFERGFYAAPLGWIDYSGNSEFIVGIRSALISGNHARLYAGAGIVEGSEPSKELAEIQLKFQGLLKALSYC
ncbi:MAG: isochorismate synthase [Crocosphaera sp.]|nr:isochorismate synthase [Crocosphaera sp.]